MRFGFRIVGGIFGSGVHRQIVVVDFEPPLPSRKVERTKVRLAMRVVLFVEVFELCDRLQARGFTRSSGRAGS